MADRSGSVLLVALNPSLCGRLDEAIERDAFIRPRIAVEVQEVLRGILDEVVPE